MNEQVFLNTKINNVHTSDVIDFITDSIKEKKPAYIVELNVDVILKIEKDPELKKACDNASLSLVDGKPLIWISKLLKRPVVEKISGSDLIPIVCENAAKEGHRIYMLGGKKEILKKAINNLENKYEGISIVGACSPPYGFEEDEMQLEKIRKSINQCKPDILFVFFGCPKQEKWVYKHYKEINTIVTLCGGGTVDFLSGSIIRAPKWMSDHGLEWFFRFLMEPRRLFKRYFIDDPAIVFLVYRYWKKGRKYAFRNTMHND